MTSGVEYLRRQEMERAIRDDRSSLPQVSYLKQSLNRYARQRESSGCGPSCLIHAVMFGLLFVTFMIWCVRNRAWELVITVIWPE